LIESGAIIINRSGQTLTLAISVAPAFSAAKIGASLINGFAEEIDFGTHDLSIDFGVIGLDDLPRGGARVGFPVDSDVDRYIVRRAFSLITAKPSSLFRCRNIRVNVRLDASGGGSKLLEVRIGHFLITL